MSPDIAGTGNHLQLKTSILGEDSGTKAILPCTLSKGGGKLEGELTVSATDCYVAGHFPHVALIL